jgi:hypothetical protein
MSILKRIGEADARACDAAAYRKRRYTGRSDKHFPAKPLRNSERQCTQAKLLHPSWLA